MAHPQRTGSYTISGNPTTPATECSATLTMILEFCQTLEPPPTISDRYSVFNDVDINRFETWFWRLPEPIGIYVTGAALCRHADMPVEGAQAIQSAIGRLAGVVSASQVELARDVAHWHNEAINNSLVAVASYFAKSVLERHDVRWFYDRFHLLLLSEEDRSGSILSTTTEIIGKIRDLFNPPPEFTPKNEVEWLIAADMLEEAGDIRCEAIRLAATNASDAEIFRAVYKALPEELLSG